MAKQDEQLDANMRQWWMLSAPYSLVFVASVLIAERIGYAYALFHSGLIIPLLLVAIAASLSSGLWFLTMARRLVRGESRINLRYVLMMVMSAIPAVWCILYLSKW